MKNALAAVLVSFIAAAAQAAQAEKEKKLAAILDPKSDDKEWRKAVSEAVAGLMEAQP